MMKYLLLALLIGIAVADEAQGGYGTNEAASEYAPDHKDRGFTVRRAVVKDLKYIGFKDLIHDFNVGGSFFNKEFGFYRAEVGGMFFFSFQVVSTKEKYLRVSLRIDGKPQIWATAQRGYNQAGNSAVVQLNKGQVVYLYIEDGAVYEPSTSYRGYNTFTGHRLTYDESEPIAPRTSNRRETAEEKKDIAEDKYDEKITAWPTTEKKD
ncbi:Uncharacterised protein g6605 [Pycnogonum litorale]